MNVNAGECAESWEQSISWKKAMASKKIPGIFVRRGSSLRVRMKMACRQSLLEADKTRSPEPLDTYCNSAHLVREYFVDTMHSEG